MTTPLLDIQHLFHERGGRELYGGLDLQIKPGEIVHVRGPNGHGKSTLLRICAGLLHPDSGQRRWRGGEFAMRMDESVAPIVWAGEAQGWSGAHSVRDNWDYLRALQGVAAEPEGVWIEPDWWARPYADLSTGQRKRVSLALVAASPARLWCLDEPLSGLDQHASQIWQQRMRAAADAGVAVMVVSHETLPDIVDRHLDWAAPC